MQGQEGRVSVLIVVVRQNRHHVLGVSLSPLRTKEHSPPPNNVISFHSPNLLQNALRLARGLDPGWDVPSTVKTRRELRHIAHSLEA